MHYFWRKNECNTIWFWLCWVSNGGCLAEVGNDVVCIDVDQQKIDNLKKGIIPIYEPVLDQLVKDNQQAGRIKFTTDIQEAVSHGVFSL